MNKRMDRTRLNIGAYILQDYARTAQHIEDIAKCGIDFIVCMENDRAALDKFYQYGLGAIVTGVFPGWWGGDGDNAGTMAKTNPIESYVEAIRNFQDHPAIWGLDIGDEPSALDFPHYGKVYRTVNGSCPNQFPYLNLYPNYASVAQNTGSQVVNQLGTATYKEHIEAYCRNVPADYICYDFYVYSGDRTWLVKDFDNLKIVSDAARKTGKSFWFVAQVNSNRPEEHMTENTLRFQAYSALAFGAENLIWGCYTGGWWHNNVLDTNGNNNPEYDILQKVNHEIRGMADEYMKYRRVDTHFVGFENMTDDLAKVDIHPVKSLDLGCFMDVHAEDSQSILVGQMVSRKNTDEQALLIAACDDVYDEHHQTYQITFRADNRAVRLYNGRKPVDLICNKDGTFSFEISSCDGVLITAK